MKVVVEPQNTPNVWRLGGNSALLQIRANEAFDTFNGQYVPAARVDEGLCLETVCPIVANSLLIPDVELDSTEDSITNPRATYDAVLVSKGKKINFLLNFRVPATLPNLTWPILRLRKTARIPLRLSDTYNSEQIESLIAQSLTFLRLASITQVGMAASSHPATDPGFPTHVSVTHPLIVALEAGQGLIAAAGKADMVNSAVTVLTAVVLETSVIVPASMDAGVTGALRVVNIVPGVSFNIVSSNFGDNGEVSWILSNP